ncbi:hypothetical protein BVC80_9101g150 [Macleaya cordata]|uniref:Uncharacterized protein n=1 Tax=Macleaya cordata TaxID=56857 RepID=A0A200QGP6_MACCD|nr:hypothetical protein BVC80_9101g150 [Macleaya cordata]
MSQNRSTRSLGHGELRFYSSAMGECTSIPSYRENETQLGRPKEPKDWNENPRRGRRRRSVS